MTEYTWDLGPLIVTLSDNGLQCVVHTVNWRLTGRQNDHHASVYGSVTVPPPGEGAFIAFPDLTLAQVEAWVMAALGDEVVASYKSAIEAQIDLQINPVEATLPPPWANA